MTAVNRQLVLHSRPKGMLAPGDLQLKETAVPGLQDGQALARVKYLSIDPTMRIWMAADSYLPAVAIGEVMRSFGFAEIVESRHPDYRKGDRVTGFTGLQDYVAVELASQAFQKVPKIPFATGSIVGQIGKIRGCRVVGIAGTDDKCNWLSKDLGFDAAINYKHRDWKGKLAAAVPDGIDIDFENVGGEIMQTVLGLMNLHGRVVVCGLISGYNKQDPGMMSLGTVILKRLRVEGFLLLDYVSRFMEAATQLGQWKMFGKIKDRETIVEGLEKTPDAINMLFTGANTGKLIVKI
ncbi:MAG: NADP-dependent oxidoreductase [Acidobacteria bacterium]|nr:MAG: NADP-dependent oxidoreductase [Acidobacteriota bacterium]